VLFRSIEALDGGFSIGKFRIDLSKAHLANRLLFLVFGFLLVRHFNDLLSVDPMWRHAKSVN
jgi:hypothetical protein